MESEERVRKDPSADGTILGILRKIGGRSRDSFPKNASKIQTNRKF